MNTTFKIIFFLVLFYIAIAVWTVWLIKNEKRKLKEVNEKIDAMKNNAITMTPEEFMQLRNTPLGGGKRIVASQKNFAGVYILYNQTKNLYYVGQASKILNRVNNHFTGHGNGDVYADYKYGDKFEISMIELEHSGFESLNELERCTIRKYDAFSKGYNKTRGNHG